MASSAELQIIIKAQNSATATLQQIQKSLKGLEDQASRSNNVLRTVGQIASGIQLSGFISRIEDIGVGLVKTGVGFSAMKEQAQIAFTTMLGSAQRAQIFLDRLQQFAKETPFEFPELVTASQRLMAMGFAAGEVVPTLTALGDAVAGLGGSSEMLDRVINALGQMRAKAVVSGEEMRQLTEAGIPAWENLAAAIGKSVPEAMKLVENRMVSASVGIQAQIDGINRKFGGMMAQQSKTFNGMISNLKDNISQASGQVFEPLFLKAKEGMESLLGVTGSPEWQTNLDRIELGVFDIIDAIQAAIDKTGKWIDKLGEAADKVKGPLSAAAAFIAGVPLTGLRATGILGSDNGGGGQQTKPFTGVSNFQLRENELRGKMALQDRLRQGQVSQEELELLESMSVARARETRAMDEQKRATNDTATASEKAAEAIRTFGDVLISARDKLTQAASSLFSRPTREQAQAQLRIDRAQLSFDALQRSIEPARRGLDALRDAADASARAFNLHRLAMSDAADALSDRAAAIDRRIRDLQHQADSGGAGGGFGRQIIGGGGGNKSGNGPGESEKAGNVVGIDRTGGNATNSAIDALQRERERISDQQEALQRRMRDEEKAFQREQLAREEEIRRREEHVAAMTEAAQRQLDLARQDAAIEEDRRKILQDNLVLADKTLLTDQQQYDLSLKLIEKTSDFTGKIQEAADAAGITLVSGFDDAMNAEANLALELRTNTITAFQDTAGAVRDLGTAIAPLLRLLGSNPTAPPSSPPFDPSALPAGFGR